MRPPLEIPTARHYWKRIVLLYVLVLPFVALGVGQAAKDIGRPERREMVWAMASIGVFLLLAPTVLLLARRRWVRRMDEHGVTLRSGRTFAWRDFRGVETRLIENLKPRIVVNHYDLVFTTGRAGVFFRMAANEDEVELVVDRLARGENPFVAPAAPPAGAPPPHRG
jgi:hypothetical protein